MNYLTPILKDYFMEITSLEGVLLTVDSFINSIQDQNKSKPENCITQLISSYRDLSQLGAQNNLYETGFEYNYTISDLQNEAFLLSSRECCFTIAQAYEIFESFLKKIVFEMLRNNQEYTVFVTRGDTLKPTSNQDFKNLVDQLQRRDKNNKKFLWLFRKISTLYKTHEKENIWNYNFADWFDLISEIRHAIVHSRQHLTDKVQLSIGRNKNRKIFNRYFDAMKSEELGLIITHRLNAGELINLFNQFAFLIWKSISTECELELNYS